MRRVASKLAGLVFASAAATQSLSVTPGNGLTTGATATIAYDNPSRANQTIVVTVSGGFPVLTTIEITIQLDASGKGSAKWVVLAWVSAHFDAPDTHTVTEAIR